MLFFLTSAGRHQDGHASLILQNPGPTLYCFAHILEGKYLFNLQTTQKSIFKLHIPFSHYNQIAGSGTSSDILECLQTGKHYPILGMRKTKTRQVR